MAQLRHDYQKFIEQNTEVIAVGPEDNNAFAEWWHSHKMPFVGIADKDHVIAKMYGQQVKILHMGRMPASFIIDRNGYIRYRHFGQSMSDIPKNQDILSLLAQLDKE
jgi:peroxiredoxin